MQLKSKVLVGVSALGLAAGGGGAAFATAGKSTASTPPRQQAFLQDVAKRLGVTEAALTDALKGAAGDQVDAAVAAGKLTKEQGDAIKARIQAGEGIPFFVGPGPGPSFGHRALGFGAIFSAAADYLGISTQTLRTDLESGKSLADVAQAAGKSVDGLKTAILDAVKKQLDSEVAAGRLTAAQEQDMFAKLTARIDELVNGTPSTKQHFGYGLRRVGA
jgi:hypothetical protein